MAIQRDVAGLATGADGSFALIGEPGAGKSVLAATAPQAWRRAWWRRLRHVRRALPRAWTGLGLADRGLDARWVCRRLTRLGGHPFLRIHTGGPVRPTGHGRGGPLKTVGPEPGPTWQGTGSAFKGRNRQLHWTLRAGGEPGEQEPWVLLTALPPEAMLDNVMV